MKHPLPRLSELISTAPLRRRAPLYLLAALALLFCCAFTVAPDANATAHLSQASFTLDGVTVSVQGTFIPGTFTVTTPDNMTQMADAVALHPYREFQVEAIPFQTKASEEVLPPAQSGDAATYRSILHAFRASHGARTLAGSPTITIFGQRVRGESNLVQLPLGGTAHQYSSALQTAVMTEYVAEAGNRLWLVRITQEQTTGGLTPNVASTSFLNSLSSTSLSSATLNRPSTHVAALAQEAKEMAARLRDYHNKVSSGHGGYMAKTAANLWPGWWNGVCDYNNFIATGWQSWQMNSGYDGVYPCGPRPAYGGPDYLVQFYSGAWGEYEWECVELSMRWMYLAYGVVPYPANGNQVVSNYSTSDGGGLHRYSNFAGCCGYPMPSDIISYCSTCTYGHTSVVISASVDGNGNGSITVMEQNATYGGLQQLQVSDYEVVNAPEGFVYGWLSTRIW